ncbi:MAG: amidohydrolase family protein [Ignavibacteriae bacterium]|nr:amidohydrolase family protein [Ignavibacteriota bacterium]
MKIIDGHIHIGKWSNLFFNYETTVEQAAAIMKRARIEGAVCLPADDTPNIKLLTETKSRNDFNFYFAAWINPDDKELDSFLENNLNDVSLFKFHPSVQRRRITDESYRKYIELASETGKPIVVHCGRWQEIASYKFPLELARKYPTLKIILAHLGGDQPSIYLECAREVSTLKSGNIFLGTESVREFYFVNEVVKTVGADKVIFGSDYNLGLPEMYIPVIENLSVSNEEKEMIFSGNILRILK